MLDRKALVAHLKAGRLTDAAAMIWDELHRSEGTDASKIFDEELFELADDSPESLGIAVYGLLAHMIHLYGEEAVIERTSGRTLHGAAAGMLMIESCWIPGAESLALHHSRRMAELRPNDVDALESVLFHFRSPDQVLSSTDAENYAHRILKLDPKNRRALEVLSDISEHRQRRG